MLLLIANRSEIAVRIAQTAQRMGMETLGVCASDEGLAHHSPYMDRVAELPGSGSCACGLHRHEKKAGGKKLPRRTCLD